MKVAFLGYGAIAEVMHRTLESAPIPGMAISACLARNVQSSRQQRLTVLGIPCVGTLPELLATRPDVVVEAAGQEAAASIVPGLLTKGVDVVSLSVGAYLDPALYGEIQSIHGGRLLVPSGALPGVDVIKAAAEGEITAARLESRKHPRSLAGAPGMEGIGDLMSGPRHVFNGTAQEAVRRFPSNANIAATLSLAGIGPIRTEVTIIADPGVTMNVHTVCVEGTFGRFNAQVECEPSDNPRTSLLAALSAVAILRDRSGSVRVGT